MIFVSTASRSSTISSRKALSHDLLGEDDRLPSTPAAREALAVTIGNDGGRLFAGRYTYPRGLRIPVLADGCSRQNVMRL